jgi:tetratricopeptide (TPR) repeat protein
MPPSSALRGKNERYVFVWPYNRDMSAKAVVVLCCLFVFLGLALALPQTDTGRQQEIEKHGRQAAEYLKESKLDLAAAEFKAILAIDPKNVDARGNLGVVQFFRGNYMDAIPELRAAAHAQPRLWKIQALLGMAEKRTGDIAAGRRDLEQAFPNVPQQRIKMESGMELIEIYSSSGDLDKAAAIVSDLRKLEPTDEAVLYTAYRIYSDLANESLLSLSVAAPNSARMHQALAHELAKRGNTTEAIQNYRAALQIDPKLPGLHFELAEMLHTMAAPEARQEAVSEYKAALQANQFDEQSECRLAEIALEGGDVNEAKQRYSRSILLQPNDPEASIGLAKVYMTMDQPQQAEPLLQRAIKLDPTSSLAHFRLSTVYRLMGRADDAKRELAEYQKYKEMKDKLRAIYHDFEQAPEENEAATPKQ